MAARGGGAYRRDHPRTSPKKMGRVRTDLGMGCYAVGAITSLRKAMDGGGKGDGGVHGGYGVESK